VRKSSERFDECSWRSPRRVRRRNKHGSKREFAGDGKSYVASLDDSPAIGMGDSKCAIGAASSDCDFHRSAQSMNVAGTIQSTVHLPYGLRNSRGMDRVAHSVSPDQRRSLCSQQCRSCALQGDILFTPDALEGR